MRAPVFVGSHQKTAEELNRAESPDLLMLLNDGVELPIVDRSENWYQVELPNGKVGWMDGFWNR